jgi:hypothetical protein
MTTTINAVAGTGLVQTSDASGIIKLQSAGVTTDALAWVNFNGTGTVAIRSAYNVSSITDNGTGDYTINFTTALSDANYAVTGTAQYDTASNVSSDLFAGVQPVRRSTAFATTGIRVGTCRPSDGANLDFIAVSVAIFGN